MFLEEMNKAWLEFLNSLWQNEIISQSSILLADTPIFFLPIFLVTAWILSLKNNNSKTKNNLLFIFYSSVIAIIINLIIQQFFHFERPELFLENVWKLLLDHIPDASFPSDHAAVSVSFLTGLFLFGYKKVWYYFGFFVILMLISRIIVWVHWPLDIIVWSIIWVISAFIIKKLVDNKLIKNINNTIIKYEPFALIYNFLNKK